MTEPCCGRPLVPRGSHHEQAIGAHHSGVGVSEADAERPRRVLEQSPSPLRAPEQLDETRRSLRVGSQPGRTDQLVGLLQEQDERDDSASGDDRPSDERGLHYGHPKALRDNKPRPALATLATSAQSQARRRPTAQK